MQGLNRLNLLQAIRQFIYVLLGLCVILGVRGITYYYKSSTFAEHGIIENAQLFLLLTSTLIFLVLTLIYRQHKTLFYVLASLSCFAACRELDRFFFHLLPIISWKFAYMFPILALLNAWRYKNNFIHSLNYFLTSPAFYMMIMALVIALPIAQGIGDKRLVTNVLGTAQMKEIKELFEEHCELIGYFFIFLSSIECFLDLKKQK